MFSKVLTRIVAMLVIVGLLGGCAEIDRRGGVVDQVEDYILFRADTKSHRLFRSYLLIGVLLAAARREPHNEVDQGAIEGNLKIALAIANEAFYCLYPGTAADYPANERPPQEIVDSAIDWGTKPPAIRTEYRPPKWCQFFDERMARLDYAIYRLAMTTLFSAEGRKYLSDVRDQLIGKVPVLSDGLRAAISANKVLGQASTLVDDLLNLTFKTAGPATALLPLYRDALEVNMIVIINTLQLRCYYKGDQAKADVYKEYVSLDNPVVAGYEYPYKSEDDCDTLRHAVTIFNRGNGNLRQWREFVWYFNGSTASVEAYRPHFLLVTQLMVRSCIALLANVTKDDRCKAVLNDALEHSAAFNIDNRTGVPDIASRRVTASLFPYPASVTRFATTRSRPAVARTVPAVSDPQTTGSIPRPNATQVPASHAPAVVAPPPP